MEEPGDAAQVHDPQTLAGVLRAFGVFKRTNAMDVIASYTSDPRSSVREAARWSLEQYGGNAIWSLREAYAVRLGEPASLEWSFRQTADTFYRRVDEELTRAWRGNRLESLDHE